MIGTKDLAKKLPELRVNLKSTLQHDGASAALAQLMPLFLSFLQHEDRLRQNCSPEARKKLEALQAAAVTFGERLRGTEGEPVVRIRGYIANALTPCTAPVSTFAVDGLVRTAVATAFNLDVDDVTRRVAGGSRAQDLVNTTLQQTDALVEIIGQILQPTSRPGVHAREVIACSVAGVLVDSGIVVSTAPNGAFDAALRHVLEALGSYDDDPGRLLEVGIEHVTPKQRARADDPASQGCHD